MDIPSPRRPSFDLIEFEKDEPTVKHIIYRNQSGNVKVPRTKKGSNSVIYSKRNEVFVHRVVVSNGSSTF